MAGTVSEEPAAGRSLDGLSSGQRCQSSDTLAEYRSSDNVENGTPSTSPPYWDSDDSDDDGGPKPSELYGKYTWKIEKFSQINKRELRSNAFEVGGYKWYILIYPQGCDVCNHLSLFLCVANHDKLLPGWSHFAQFTIAVVNKDPKKSKYSDTLHRFWKKEHDWGWKKFMELSKVSDGFVDADTLIIKAQVQVIREKADRPFRCLDCQYRRELVRVYLTNVEQICRRYVEERRGKLGKLLEDKARWSSFCAFWLGMDQNARRRMSREKKDIILKVVVKQFFIEKEVTSTLVMDSLYSGLKALEGQSKDRRGKAKILVGEETPAPIVQVEKDMFVLVDDILLLLERAAMEPLPPKDEKGPQNRTKDGGSGEDFNKDSVERDERRLTELGRRTVEIFVLAHIFSNKIEAAYQEAVALKRQEELIREEEAAWLAESEQKAKRGAEKDKKSKKKQGKQKRNNRKGKDKTKDDKPIISGQDKLRENPGKDMVEGQTIPEKDDGLEDESDVSDSGECLADVLQPDSEDQDRGDASPVNWDTDTSEIQPTAESSASEITRISTMQNGGVDKRNSSVMDDSSSTCSTDSTPSVVMNGSYSNRTNPSTNYKSQKSPTRGKSQGGKPSLAYEADSRPSEAPDAAFRNDTCSSRKAVELNESEGIVTSLQDRTKWPELNAAKKEDEGVLLQKKGSRKDSVMGSSKEKIPVTPPCVVKSPPKNVACAPIQAKSELKSNVNLDMVSAKKTLSNGQEQTDKTTLANACQPAIADCTKAVVPKLVEKVTGQQVGGLSRPSSAPLIPGTLPPAAPAVSAIQSAASSAPLLSRSISAAGRLGPDPSPSPSSSPSPGAQAFIPQSYRNAIIGSSMSVSTAGVKNSLQPATAVVNNSTSTTLSQPQGLVPMSIFLPQEEVLGGQPWMTSPQRDISRTSLFESSPSMNMIDDIPKFDLYRPMNSGIHELFPSEMAAAPSGRHVQGALADEFPHLDIINDLLDDEQSMGRWTHGSRVQGLGSTNGPTALFNRQFTYPTGMNLSSEMMGPSPSGRLDRSRTYHENGFHHQPGTQYTSVREFIPQAQGNSMPYMNCQIDNVVPNQWQLLGPDLSLLGMTTSGMDGYPYNISDYADMA